MILRSKRVIITAAGHPGDKRPSKKVFPLEGFFPFFRDFKLRRDKNGYSYIKGFLGIFYIYLFIYSFKLDHFCTYIMKYIFRAAIEMEIFNYLYYYREFIINW
jgi:hypothetical protein